MLWLTYFFFSSRRRHTRYWRDWSSDVCSSDLATSVRSAAPDQRAELVERARELKGVVAEAEAEARELDAQLQDLLLGIPNLPADDVPDGSSEDDAAVVRVWGEPQEFDFAPRAHVELGERAIGR